MPIVTLLGLVGNVLSILVLRSPGIDMKVGFFAFVFVPRSDLYFLLSSLKMLFDH